LGGGGGGGGGWGWERGGRRCWLAGWWRCVLRGMLGLVRRGGVGVWEGEGGEGDKSTVIIIMHMMDHRALKNFRVCSSRSLYKAGFRWGFDQPACEQCHGQAVQVSHAIQKAIEEG